MLFITCISNLKYFVTLYFDSIGRIARIKVRIDRKRIPAPLDDLCTHIISTIFFWYKSKIQNATDSAIYNL